MCEDVHRTSRIYGRDQVDTGYVLFCWSQSPRIGQRKSLSGLTTNLVIVRNTLKPEGQRPRTTYPSYIEILGQDRGKSLLEMNVMCMDRNRWRRWSSMDDGS